MTIAHSEPADGNAVAASITSVSFQGPTVLLVLQAIHQDGAALSITVPLSSSEALKPGDTVWLTWAETAGLILTETA